MTIVCDPWSSTLRKVNLDKVPAGTKCVGRSVSVTTFDLAVTIVESVRDSKSERSAMSLLTDTIVRVKL
jgi:hypothetical protein